MQTKLFKIIKVNETKMCLRFNQRDYKMLCQVMCVKAAAAASNSSQKQKKFFLALNFVYEMVRGHQNAQSKIIWELKRKKKNKK